MITYGYIYCITNPSMPNYVKVGMTERTPEIRLKEANIHDTWKSPTKYILAYAKYVKEPLKKEKIIHKLLEKYTKRINKTEFFETSSETVLEFFELIDGEMWDKNEIEIIAKRPKMSRELKALLK